jgi:N-acyl-L-homoserine lactone synthetase
MVVVKKVVSLGELYDVFRLRYKVYCIERGYEEPEDHPNGLEMDVYDPYSIHFISYIEGIPVGAVRLILSNSHGFPVERYCGIDTKSIYPDTSQIAEISRLAVSSGAINGFSIKKSYITLSLLRELYNATRELCIRYFFAAMSKGLERMLNKCEIRFSQIGAPVCYHGIRAPYCAEVDELKSGMAKNKTDISEFILNLSRCH